MGSVDLALCERSTRRNNPSIYRKPYLRVEQAQKGFRVVTRTDKRLVRSSLQHTVDHQLFQTITLNSRIEEVLALICHTIATALSSSHTKNKEMNCSSRV